MSTSAGTLTIDIEAKTARLEEGMRRASRSVRRSSSAMSAALGSLKTQLAAVAGIGALGLFVKRSFDAADALGDMADNLGVSTNALAKFQYAASFAGLSSEQAGKLIEKQSVTLGKAASEAGAARDAFNRLGLDAQLLANQSPDQAFRKISDAIGSIPNQSERARVSVEIFGKSGTSAMAFIREGSAGLDKAAEQAERIGVALSNVDNAKLEQARDSMQRVGSVFAGIGNRIAVALAPYLKWVSDWFVNSAADANGWKDGINTGLAAIAHSVAFVADIFRGLQVVWKILEVAWAGFQGLVFVGLNEIQKGVVWLASALPGLGDIKPNPSLQQWADESVTNINRLNDELEKLVMAEMPSAGIEEFFEKIKQESDSLAKKLADDRKKNGQNGAVEDVRPFRNNFDADFLSKIAEQGRSEQELLNAQYEQKRIDLENFYVTSDMTDEAYRQRSTTLEEDYQKKLTDIRNRGLSARSIMWRKAWAGDLKSVAGVFGEVSDLMQSSSRKQFEIGKKAAIGQSLINTSLMVTEGLKTQPFFPVGLAMGALALTKGMTEVNKIKSQSFGGGGGGGSSGAVGTFPASPNTGLPTQQPGLPQTSEARGNTVQIIIEGNVIGSDEYVNGTLIPALANAVNNNDVVLISSNSRNAREIVGA